MAKSPNIEGFLIAKDDPLRAEHDAVSAWIEDAACSPYSKRYYDEVDLKSLPSGKKLFDAKVAEARRYVVAAVAQVRHWDEMAERVRAQAANELQRVNAHHLPGWGDVWCRRRYAEAVIRTLMRRKLPLQRNDLIDLLHWCNDSDGLSTYSAPIGYIVRALERFAEDDALDDEICEAMRKLAERLRSSRDNTARRFGTSVEQLCARGIATEDEAQAAPCRQSPQPSRAGQPRVLETLKRLFGMLAGDADSSTTIMGPDLFPIVEDSPLEDYHTILSRIFEELGTSYYDYVQLDEFSGERDADEAGRMLLAATERHVHALLAPADHTDGVWQARYAAAAVMLPLLKTHFTLPRDGIFDLLLYLSVRPPEAHFEVDTTISELIERVQQEAEYSVLSEGERFVLSLFRVSLISGPPLGSPTEAVRQLTQMIGDGWSFCLVPGEVWADAVNDDFSGMSTSQQRKWSSLFAHMLTATTARPSGKWLKTAAQLVSDIGAEAVRVALERWLPLVSQGRSTVKIGAFLDDARGAADTMHEENATCLRGLLWLVSTLPDAEKLTRHVTTVALSAYRKVPGVGPRAVKVGNAAVNALSQLASNEAVGQLAMLKVRVKFGTAQKVIEQAFNVAAQSLGLPRDEIEEIGIPAYGLEEGGTRQETIGVYRAELVVTESNARLNWFDAKGKALRSVPAKVRKDHKDDLKDLRQSLKDIQGMLPAQRDRIDSMFLLQKSWPIDQWRERYLKHPLIGTIARRLLWRVDGTAALFVDGAPTDVRGQSIDHSETADITLWHPVGCSVEEITAWRARLEAMEITQPFKQAHREIYLLTDAERNTRSYSNRFAAHVIRQHQFNALCAARGWKNKLRLMVDDAYAPPTKELPQWNLRAEFWVEGIGDEYATDTNDSGVYLRLTTDQVRFFHIGAAWNSAHAAGGRYASEAGGPGRDNINEPLPLEKVPTLVFSEILRDVDLFVGVASVGNDPTWHDGGPEGRYWDYWQSYSFGELSGTASTRKQVLMTLIPRLKIADRCSFVDRFVVVRGDKRTYKIHLGSGNILMEPNDEYLCIVPDSRSRSRQDDIFLPFEGDSMLSIIISKALLLAEDTRIKDRTILSQIERF